MMAAISRTTMKGLRALNAMILSTILELVLQPRQCGCFCSVLCLP
jgi:hypothetical protein